MSETTIAKEKLGDFWCIYGDIQVYTVIVYLYDYKQYLFGYFSIWLLHTLIYDCICVNFKTKNKNKKISNNIEPFIYMSKWSFERPWLHQISAATSFHFQFNALLECCCCNKLTECTYVNGFISWNTHTQTHTNTHTLYHHSF